jgi:S-DNA-T family DNA segregation ATPase FtsK/SpoIIIE
VRKFLSQEAQLQLGLGRQKIRLLGPIPGRSQVGVEIPNAQVELVRLKEVLDECSYRHKLRLPIALGYSISDSRDVCQDLTSLVHLLVSGGLSSGKTMLLRAILASLLFLPPSRVNLLIISSHPTEFASIDDALHMVTPIVRDPKQTVRVLKEVQNEVRRRQTIFERLGVKSLEEYHRTASPHRAENLPHWVILIDNYEQVMVVSKTEVTNILNQLTLVGRHTGLHLIVSTRRPLATVIASAVKANFPSQIAFLQSRQDSRLIFGQSFPDVEKLLGKGDMFLKVPGRSEPERIQGCFVSDTEIDTLVDHWRQQLRQSQKRLKEAEEKAETTPGVQQHLARSGRDRSVSASGEDELQSKAIEIVRRTGYVSLSRLKKELGISSREADNLLQKLKLKGLI